MGQGHLRDVETSGPVAKPPSSMQQCQLLRDAADKPLACLPSK